MMESDEAKAPEVPFKKPLLVGKIGKLPRKLQSVAAPPEPDTPPEDSSDIEAPVAPSGAPRADVKVVPYEKPPWSGLPDGKYTLEVLKSGAIIDNIGLREKEFWVFGRLVNCDVCMQHPTISRYHAVLQYGNGESKPGFYVYDLESTHGTFLNKNRIRPRSYVRVKVGHMLKLGCSTRTYILNGPPEDAEEESPLSITELKMKRQQELEKRRLDEEERKRKEEEKGIDWGLGEDADEETDLTENPFAQTNNEDLYLDNPKKALRGFFEREGLDLEYDCSEQGMGQFVCKVELPVDDETGRPIFAEVFHKGKKKEAVVQCALEACRILDRHGLLRQATHESKKRKPKNWEENDYYDSDDDTFLDRTGTVEKKREMRMNSKLPQKAETYDSLMDKERSINEKIKTLQTQLSESLQKINSEASSSSDPADPLDSFMIELTRSRPSKQTINKLKSDLIKLKQEHTNVIRLINIARPASLPPLVAEYSSDTPTKNAEKKPTLPIFGKRKKIKVQLANTTPDTEVKESGMDDEEEEEEEADDDKKISEPKTEVEKSSILEDSQDETKMTDEENVERKRRKNQRRIQHKQEKAQIEKRKGYEEDAGKEDYNMWVPPTGQTGDGRTSLNEKYGY